MPCRGSAIREEQFRDSLDEIYELCAKFSSSHHIILCGDLNASLFQSRCSRDRLFQSWITTVDLSLCPNYPNAATHYHHNGIDSSSIDYIITSPNFADFIRSVKILDLSDNTSPHHPVSLVTSLELSAVQTKHQIIQPSKKLMWDKCDQSAYERLIQHNTSLVVPASKEDINTMLQDTADTLLQASKTYVPSRKAGKKRSQPWSPIIADALHNHKQALYTWIQDGRPSLPAPSAMRRKKTKKLLRSMFRQEVASRRSQFYTRVTQSWPRDSKTFHDLIKRQRSSSNAPLGATLRINNTLCSDQHDILAEWTKHFSTLAKPLEASHFNDTYLKDTLLDVSDIESLSRLHHSDLSPNISSEEITHAIQKLNSGKAADDSGLTAEHLKHCLPVIAPVLAVIFSAMFRLCHIPLQLKTGFTIPIHKKGKDPYSTDSYRGITITPILGKVFEHILIKRFNKVSSQSDLQFGFTEGRSPSMAALIVTEAITTNLDMKRPSYVAALDVQKAFDVVSHPILKKRIFTQCQDPPLWTLMASAIDDNCTTIRVNHQHSDPILLTQGVGQGRISSTVNYKTYIDPLLKLLESARVGTCSGPLYIGAPTCADDLMLIADSPEDLQAMLNLTYNFSSNSRYIIHPSKSQIVTYGDAFPSDCYIGPNPVPEVDGLTHLGILRNSNDLVPNTLIDERISLANRTAYSLMGAGLHGKNGLPPGICLHIYHTYVLPRMLYGLEALPLKPNQIVSMEKTHRKFLRCFQSLPIRVAIPSIYLLLGEITLEARLHIRILVFLQSILADSHSLIYRLAVRSIFSKDPSSRSWFLYVAKLLEKYDLPNLPDLLASCPARNPWKSYVNSRVSSHCWASLQDQALQKSSLSLLNVRSCSIGNLHPVWRNHTTTTDIRRATIKAKLICNVYILQSHRSRFNKSTVDPTCRLCGSGAEDREHFLIKCSALHATRQKHIVTLYQLYPVLSSTILLDSSLVPEYVGPAFEHESQKLIHRLHETRNILISDL